jgi:aminopeptidase N
MSNPLAFTHTDAVITVTFDSLLQAGEEFSFDVAYHGMPPTTGLGSFRFSQHLSVPWIYTLSQPYGSRDWWPCKDHPLDKADSVDIVVTCDSTFKVASNGTLISVVNNGDGTSTTHWQERYPISTYLVSIAITVFEEFSNWFHYAPGDSMEILNYVRPDRLTSAQASLPKTVQMLEIFSDMFGLYPFVEEKYGHADFGWGGAMEHQTMTSTGTYNENTIAHEAAHQWFGDMITCETWPDLWLNEGFATYATGLYLERRYDSTAFRNYMIGRQLAARNAIGTLYVQDTASVGNLFAGSRVYAKGACVLHMLRYVLGDSVFFDAMYAYANDPALMYGTATTADFQRNCETTSGKDLDWFFDQWVYGEKYPIYQYGWISELIDTVYRVDLRMVQETNTTNPVVFRVPMDVVVYGAGWDTTIAVIDSLNTQDFVFELPASPVSIALDPAGWNLLRATLVSYILLDVDETADLPESPTLLQNYPNPFNPVTTVSFLLPERSRVRLRVCNLIGEEIVVLYEGTADPGGRSADWDASSYPSGVYLGELLVEPLSGRTGYRSVKKMLLLR